MLLPWHVEERLFRVDAIQRVDTIRYRIRELVERKFPRQDDPSAEQLAERRRGALERKVESAVLGSIVADFLARRLSAPHMARGVFNEATAFSRAPKPGSTTLNLVIDREPMMRLERVLRLVRSRAEDLGVKEPELVVLQLALKDLPLDGINRLVDGVGLQVQELKEVVECSADSSLSQPLSSA